jgi:predicted AlkP superfamily pyrophosphatase or phosphodiesterase
MPPLVLINAVGLTPRLLANAPHLRALAGQGWARAVREVLPAVTCTAQASILTGVLPEQHGIVGNGWLYRDTMEVRFWQQSIHLLQAEPLYVTAKKRNPSFRCAKLFWWFNQGADVAISVTPKPHYGIDGNKVFGIHGTPEGLTEELESELGPFPFATFWGPMAGLPCTQWISKCAAKILRDHHPGLTLVYLPHLDYDPQRFGPEGSNMPRLVRELDDACRVILDAAQAVGANVWVVSEYGHVQVKRPVYLNRVLREAGLVQVRRGPFGEQLDTFTSRAFAVCDHQVAHVYVADADDLEKTKAMLLAVPGVARVLAGDHRSEIGLLHRRSGELILLSERDTWFAYPFWLNDELAPDYARTVAIHNKPGYDPCELFFDPKRPLVKGRAAFRLLQKKLGFRMKMDVIPLDASIVRGSHGLEASDPLDRSLLIGNGPVPAEDLALTDVRDLVLRALQ